MALPFSENAAGGLRGKMRPVTHRWLREETYTAKTVSLLGGAEDSYDSTMSLTDCSSLVWSPIDL